ncbi:hypothetical protein NM208_g6481 [Fusarium decemcellulare]|uniref:Uncharacterized protein n=1 Tax=Fusarium decemcellulare TaxID=57161 RepID=A0ACC1SDA8_9HYPO|nr:hypothetical protein NM208_g6481 [Fusarium decemcellulare]
MTFSTVDVNGNGIEEHASYVTFFNGRYYLYSEPWAYGRVLYFSGTIPGQSTPDGYVKEQRLTDDDGGQCGLVCYSSDDLSTWGPALEKFVLWFNSGSALKPSETSFWHLSHDYDITMDDHGNAYIVTDPFSGTFDNEVDSLSLWDIWVQKLNPQLTGTDSNATAIKILSESHREALAFTHNNGPQGASGRRRHLPEGCGGQNKGSNNLPSLNGPVSITWVWNYRTSPNNYALNGSVVHGNNAQAISSTERYIQEFDEEGRLKPYTWAPSISIPLASSPKMAPAEAVPYQPDCRVRNTTVLTQELDLVDDDYALSFPAFQRTDEFGRYEQDGLVLDGLLTIHVYYGDGNRAPTMSWQPSNISHAPTVISVPVAKGDKIDKVTLTTNATNGCYGVLVSPKANLSGYYGLISVDGSQVVAPKAQLFILSV